MEDEDTPFDYDEALKGLVNNVENDSGRKLTLQSQCEAFACLKANIKTKYVCKAFGISATAASQISGCMTTARYRRVREEYERCGPPGFQKRYLTPDLLLRMRQIQYGVDDAPMDRTKPNIKADRKAFQNIGTFEINPGEFWRVQWHTWKANPERNGWYFANCTYEGDEPQGGWHWYGRNHAEADPVEWLPFRTSGLAFAAAYVECNRKPPK